EPDQARRVRLARPSVGDPAEPLRDLQLAAHERERRLAGVAAGVERHGKAAGHPLQQGRLDEKRLPLPQAALGSIGERIRGFEAEQLAAAVTAAVERAAQPRDPLLRMQRGDGREGLRETRDALALGSFQEALQRRRASALPKVQQERDPPRHLPIVVEAPGRLEERHFAIAVEWRGARLAQRFGDGTPRRLFGDRVIARARVEQHSVDVEDHRPHPRPAHSSALSAARKASFAAGAPMLTRKARERSLPEDTLRISTPRAKSARCRSFAGLWSCSNSRKFAPETWTMHPADRRPFATRSRSSATSRARSRTSSGRAISARATRQVTALRLYGSCTLRSSAQSEGAASSAPQRSEAAARALEKVRNKRRRGARARSGTKSCWQNSRYASSMPVRPGASRAMRSTPSAVSVVPVGLFGEPSITSLAELSRAARITSSTGKRNAPSPARSGTSTTRAPSAAAW